MPLKSLELVGYKTFASKTTFEFSDTITAVVGPNGSGKSNIADALRWVLGEQSYSLLRGSKTVDMIFHGSEHRPRAGMASVTITFDNENGWLPIDFSEVAVARRAYRDGQNEYLINNQKVRLKDVRELLRHAGLADSNYTIIGQGLVDMALSLKADERRKLFEEAAGIGVYRTRREEAKRRLVTTRRNLERVQDILAELKPRLRSLERQARRVQEYDQVKQDLQVLLREWYGYHWHTAREELQRVRTIAKEQEALLTSTRAKQATFDQQVTALRSNVHGLRARLNSWHRELAQLHTRRERVSRELAVADERQRALSENQTRVERNQTQINEELTLLQDRATQAAQEVTRIRAEAQEAQDELAKARKKLANLQQARQQAEKNVQDATQQLAQFQNQIARENARQEELQTRLANLQASLDSVDRHIHQATTDLATAKTAQTQTAQAVTVAEQAVANAENERIAHQETLQTQEDARKKLLEEKSKLTAEAARLQAQIEVLDQADKALAGYASGARTLLQAAQNGQLNGLLGALGSRLDVPEEYETAVAAVLGEYLDAILLEPGTNPDDALTLINAADQRVTLLPLDGVAPGEPESFSGDADRIGFAANLLKVDSALRPVVDLLLGSVLVTRTRSAARSWVQGASRARRAVTLTGEVYQTDGIIIAGKPGSAGTMGRPRQKRELAEKLAEIEKTLATMDDTRVALENEIGALHDRGSGFQIKIKNTQATLDAARGDHRQAQEVLEQATRQKNWQQSRRAGFETDIQNATQSLAVLAKSSRGLDEKITAAQETIRAAREQLAGLDVAELQADAAHWAAQSAVGERAVADAAARLGEREAALAQAQARVSGFATQLARGAAEQDALLTDQQKMRAEQAEIGEQIAGLQALIDPAEAELAGSEGEQDALQQAETAARQALVLAERRHSQAQIALARKQETLDSLRGKIEDDFGLVSFEDTEGVAAAVPLPFGDMVETLATVKVLSPEIGETIKRQRAQLRRMGAINPEAQKEYAEVEERFVFLSDQIEDLEQAEVDILEIIAELDVLMEREFRKTFDEVAREFRGAFTRLFGGGSAKLVLTDPDDLTHTGVDIEAQLPGRRMQGLSLLSGGERSLTASALVFSLLKVSPTPFCVMDEVDAMLDEANVNRFAGLLRELSEKTQFVIITHNRNTVQVADTIYGITMGRDSTSQALGLRLDEVADVVGDG